MEWGRECLNKKDRNLAGDLASENNHMNNKDLRVQNAPNIIWASDYVTNGYTGVNN